MRVLLIKYDHGGPDELFKYGFLFELATLYNNYSNILCEASLYIPGVTITQVLNRQPVQTPVESTVLLRESS